MACTDKMDKITKEMTIADIFKNFPQHSQKLAQVMTNAGLHCTSCSSSTWETLEGGMLGHGMTGASVEDLIRKLNAIITEEVDLTTITVTPRAVKKFLDIAAEEGKEGWALRFGDSVGGCSGFEYILDFSQHPEEDDEVIHSNGLDIHIKRHVIKRLMGSTIDYVDGLYGSGFKISNPNAKSSCGCGKSQGY